MWRFRVVVLVAASALAGWLHGNGGLPFTDMRNVASVLAGVNATLLGFLVSAGALLYAVANTSLARNIQRTGHFNRLLTDLFVVAGALLLALAAAVAALLVPQKVAGFQDGAVLWTVLTVLVALTGAALALLLPLGYKLWVLLVSLQPEDGTLE